MPMFERGGIRISYEEAGDPHGVPVLCVAPGGMHSAAPRWGRVPYDPRVRLPRMRVIAMDQRNAGASWAPIAAGDGWHVYTDDQLALMDHLGVERFHVLGMCIGGPHAVRLQRAAPARVRKAVLLQPIGLQDNRPAFYELFDAWTGQVARHHPEADASAFASLREALFGGDFLFGARREDVAACRSPLLVLQGDDLYHPRAISEEVAGLAPDARLVPRWKEGEDLDAACQIIEDFLS